MFRICRTAVILVSLLVFGDSAAPRAEEDKVAPCRDDAMIVFDASGSMSGNQTLGIPNSQARIDEVRYALAQVLPSAARLRKVGLVSFGPGPWNQCNVQLNLKPTADAADLIMKEVDSLIPAGKTPLTTAVEQAAAALDYRNQAGSYCGRNPTAKKRAVGHHAI